MTNCWRDAVKGKTAIQKREAWDQLDDGAHKLVSAVKERYGLARVMLVTPKGYFDTWRYDGNKDKRGRQKGR